MCWKTTWEIHASAVSDSSPESVCPSPRIQVTFSRLRVVLAREVQHPFGDIERAYRTHLSRDGPGKPPHAAADLGHIIVWAQGRTDAVEKLRQIPLTLAPEEIQIRMAILEPVVDEIERILRGAAIPEAGHVLLHRRGS